MLAYESGSSVKTALLNEDLDTPTTGATTVRVYNTAPEAGKLDVYVTTTAVTLLTDDNRPPSSSTSVKLRLINGISGNGANLLTLTANSATVASSIAPYSASTYTAVAAGDFAAPMLIIR